MKIILERCIIAVTQVRILIINTELVGSITGEHKFICNPELLVMNHAHAEMEDVNIMAPIVIHKMCLRTNCVSLNFVSTG